MTSEEKEEKIPFNWSRMQNVSEAFAPMVEKFQERAEQSKAFADDLRKKVAKLDKVECVMHGIPLTLDWDSTFSWSWKNQETTPKYHVCPLCQGERELPLVNEKYRKMGIPEKVMEATLVGFITNTPEKSQVLERVKKQTDRNRGFIIMTGEKGTGKSYLSAAVLKKYGTGLFVTEADLIGELRETYEKHEGQEKMVRKYRETKVMVLDELDSAVKGVDIQPILYRILADRYDKDKLTIITSNESLDKVLDILGERLKDRIKASFINAKFTWKSYRGT